MAWPVRMPRRLIIWGLLAALAMLALVAAIVTQSRRVREREPVFLSASPEAGRHVFVQKGCEHCHAVNGVGGSLGPDLARKRKAQSTLPQLVTAMWNHAPQMWARMQAEGVAYPSLEYPEAAQLLSYLYMARFVDSPGDPRHGREVFREKGCVRCHSFGAGAGVGPDLARVGRLDSPVAWTQALWNHATGMQEKMHAQALEWPLFEGDELSDVIAYLRHEQGFKAVLRQQSGNPDRGWKVFQSKACGMCHTLHEDDAAEAPNLGPGGKLPTTMLRFGGAMLNHWPQMQRAIRERGLERPQFQQEELADLAAFLHSLRYSEPTGSPTVGHSVFAWRGCARCHGADAEGTSQAPALRGRHPYTSVSLVSVLWQHGHRMYHRSQQMGMGWPTLLESDVGDLLSFLNTPAEGKRAAR